MCKVEIVAGERSRESRTGGGESANTEQPLPHQILLTHWKRDQDTESRDPHPPSSKCKQQGWKGELT